MRSERTIAWERLGLAFKSTGQRPWMQSHAQMPHVESLGGGLVRVYFTCRDDANRSHIGWLVTDLNRPDKIIEIAEQPLLRPGPLGSYNDAGVMSSWMVNTGAERRFYVIGWNVKTAVPLHNSIGMATGPANGAPIIPNPPLGPIFERNTANPFYVSCPCVIPDGVGGWLMYYLSGLEWGQTNGKPASRYTVWRARSKDGVTFTPDEQASLQLEHPGELAIARPCVLRDSDRWRMWHCYRGEGFGYRIGYAESADGIAWTRRDDDLDLPPSGAGFDADMTCYPYVFDHLGERWMAYSGDEFGRAGLGFARLKRERAR
jgi:hypothetical protein